MTHVVICRFRTLGYTRHQTFLVVRIFHPGLQSEFFLLRLWCRKSRKFKDVGSTRWKMTMPRSLDAEGRWLGPDKLLQYTPLNVGIRDANWHMPLTPVVLNRRVLEKKIYRIFCFLDEDMDSHSLKGQMCDISCFQICLCNANESTLIFWWWACFCSHNSELRICLLRCYTKAISRNQLFAYVETSCLIWPASTRRCLMPNALWCKLWCTVDQV